MARIYSNTNKIKFTDISDKYKVKRPVKGKLSELHAVLITHVCSHYKDTRKYRQMVVDALNLITYAVYMNEPLPFDWSINDPFNNVPDICAEQIEEALGDVFLTQEAITWDITPTYSVEAKIVATTEPKLADAVKSIDPHQSTKPVQSKQVTAKPIDYSIKTTHKHDLYIQPPNVPQFDYSKIWMSGVDGSDKLVIYNTLPDIPTKQNEISCTTDVTKFRPDELTQLYPNCIIHTRASVMYENCKDIELHEKLGLVLPIEGYTRKQLVDNLVRYPHLYKLSRYIDNKFSSFYSNIEIDGQLHDTLSIWESLPESNMIPKQAEFVKEYVARRYLLERDVKHIKHKYPLFGTLDPFLTLFMTPSDYIELGYKDIQDIAKSCVVSRVSYKQSRNPIIRRLMHDAELHI